MMTVKDKLLFQDLTAWFSDSVVDERKSQWKKMGGKEADLDTAQFIFSENPESGDTQQIFKSEPYRNEHLAVFHARYISDCIKAQRNQDIPVGKYFMPPKEIQDLVRKQMKYIWDNCDSSVSSDESDSYQTPQKTSKSKAEHFGPKWLDKIDKQTQENRSAVSWLRNNTTTSEGHKQVQNSSILGNSPAKKDKPEKNTIKSPNTSLRRQKQEEKMVKSPTKAAVEAEHSYKANSSLSNIEEERQSPQKSTNMSITSNYSLRKRTFKNYRDTTEINVDNIILDSTERRADNGHSRQKQCDLGEDFLSIQDLPKETGEMEVVVPGKNGFEVLIKT